MDKKEKYSAESLMMSYGFNPHSAFGAVKSPLYNSSTFVFKSAEEGKRYFELAYGLRDAEENEQMGMIYSRLSNPNLELFEKRLTLWDKTEAAAVFSSGMAAISTCFLSFLAPGDLLLYSLPTYGGTEHFIHQILSGMGVHSMGFYPNESLEEIRVRMAEQFPGKAPKMIYLETPANPTNTMIDIRLMADFAESFIGEESMKPLLVIDNTYMGPVFQTPVLHGADLILYSATKYIGGHSDLVAGAASGYSELIARMKEMRTFLGSMADPQTAALLCRSLETLKIRMEKQAENANILADYLEVHDLVEKLYYPGKLAESDPQFKILKKQCLSNGAMIAFDIKGGEAEAFDFLNSLKLIKLAVSLGGTESLAEHPATMTHAGISHEEQEKMGITGKLVRISVGIEKPEDLIDDIRQAFQSMNGVRKQELV
jgi:methionine-gamma-lyase